MLQVQSPYTQLFDLNGDPLNNGYVYIGSVNTNAETNPISIWWDDAGTIPAAQPLRTQNGYIVRNGSPARVFVSAEDFSITVKDKRGRVVYSELDATSQSNLTAALAASSGSSLIGFIQSGAGAVARTVQDKLRDFISVKDFGAIGDGVADDTTKIQSAINAGASVYFPAGTYKITANITIPSNRLIFGQGDSTIIKIAADGVRAFDTGIVSDKTAITIRDLLIDGGGQTSNIYTGYKSGIGISISRCSDVLIDNVTIRKMGVVKSVGDPTDDGAYGGFGIIASADAGPLKNIRINNCTITNIASGGNFNGDGITVIGSYSGATGVAVVDVVVSNCYVSSVGRHCYTAEGLLANLLPESVKFVACYAEKAALCGVDVEDARKVLVSSCTFKSCGNDQTYYNPAVAYGATYRLMAGVATTNDSQDIQTDGCTFEGCYYGYTFGASPRQTVSNSVFNGSVVSDITQGTASGALGFTLHNNQFLSVGTGSQLNYYQTSLYSGFKASSCVFNSLVVLSAMSSGEFQNCTFFAGVSIGGGGEFRRNTFNACEFRDFNGIALNCSVNNAAQPDNIISNCFFYGSGLLTRGIFFGFNSALRWKIIGCTFNGLTVAGIDHANGNAQHTFDAIGNSFISCAAGIQVAQAISGSLISNNTFVSVTGYCIAITSISSGANMLNSNITGNVADSCTNGVAINVTSGAWDYCIVQANNMRGCSGVKWNLSAGNANGATVNNLTV